MIRFWLNSQKQSDWIELRSGEFAGAGSGLARTFVACIVAAGARSHMTFGILDTM